jgi:hypothetical protein
VIGADKIEIIARATDKRGRTQPLDSAPWNPSGYGTTCATGFGDRSDDDLCGLVGPVGPQGGVF